MFLASAYKGLVHGEEKWEYYVAGLAGLVAIIAPFILGFTALAMTWPNGAASLSPGPCR